MSKTMLGTAIRAAVSEKSKQENEQTTIEENNNDSKVASNNSSKIANDKATQLRSDKSSQIENGPEDTPLIPLIELVGLNIRVPKSHRLHWLIAAKKEGSTLTAAVNEALAARYGLPAEE